MEHGDVKKKGKIMPRPVLGEEVSILELLQCNVAVNDEQRTCRFRIPSYQRPYAWTDRECCDLYDELHGRWLDDFARGMNDPNGQREWMFLGSVVLALMEGDCVSVVDGQQRLTTLSILLSAIRAASGGDDVIGGLLGSQIAPKLRLRDEDRTFFASQIVSGNLFALNDPMLQTANQAQRNIVRNAMVFKRMLSEHFQGDVQRLRSFRDFILDQVLVIRTISYDPAAAFPMFMALNGKGMDLSNSDMIKAFVIESKTYEDGEVRADYARLWQERESDLIEIRHRPEEFGEMLEHIRLIHKRAKAKVTLYQELLSVFNADDNLSPSQARPCPVYDEIVSPYAMACQNILRATYPAASNTPYEQSIRSSLQWLNRLNFADWRAVVMLLFKRGFGVAAVERFLKRYERLMAYYIVTRRTNSTRVTRYVHLIDELNGYNGDMAAFNSHVVELSSEEKQQFLDALNDDVYNALPLATVKYLLSRLNSFVSAIGTAIDLDTISVEHVLPQTTADDLQEQNPERQWGAWWTQPECAEWTHRLGNLVPISGRVNSRAQNFSFDRKRQVYAGVGVNAGRAAAGNELLTRIIQRNTWTPQDVQSNQDFLLDQCRLHWDLNVLFGQDVQIQNGNGANPIPSRYPADDHQHPANELGRDDFEQAYRHIAESFLSNGQLTATERHNHTVTLRKEGHRTLLMRITVDKPHVRIALWVDNQLDFTNRYRPALAHFHLDGWTPFVFGEKDGCGNALSIRPVDTVQIIPAVEIDLISLHNAVDAILLALIDVGVFQG